MNIAKNKTKIIAITLFLMLTFASLMASMSIVKAANVPTYAFLFVTPNPVGVNQQVTCYVWVEPVGSTPSEYLQGYMVTITKPDGTTETKGPMTAFPMGGQTFKYTPNTVGNYTFKFNYPGQTFSSSGDVHLPSESPPTTLVVQQEVIQPSWPENPLPTDYWQRPINAENRLWRAISGDWLMFSYNASFTGSMDSVSGFNAYSQAPRAPHVVWTKEIALGGLTGGQYGSFGYYSGQSYDPYVAPPIIMDGRLYYRIYMSTFGAQPTYSGFACVDLRTGQELWRNEEGNIDVGQLWALMTPAGMGVRPLLWDTTGPTWNVYDPSTGNLMLSFENAASGMNLFGSDSIVFSDDGTMLVYLLHGLENWFAMWNSTKAFVENGIMWSYPPDVYVYMFEPWPGTFDWTLGIEWNVTIPDRRVEDPVEGLIGPAKAGVASNVLVARVGANLGNSRLKYEIGYDMTTGEELWVNSNPKANYQTVFGEGIYASFSYGERRWTGYDIRTGKELWTSDQNEYPWGTYVNYAPCIANGLLYSGSFDGYEHAFDIKTGKQVWKTSSGNSNGETVTGSYIFWNGPIIADGVAFLGTGEETPTQPLLRGNRVFAINAETGEQLWNISGYMSLRAIADGYLVGYNGYDNRIYCFGKGPSATTVTTPIMAVQVGQAFTITGTVTDQSTGAKGTAAIADESMSAWMEYLYMQKPMPSDVKGVTVKLMSNDPNNNLIEIGEATTDTNGNFAFTWAPEVPGLYQIIATFEGSESYGSSTASAYLSADEASATPEATQAPQSAADLYFLPVSIGMIIAIIAVLVMMILMFRKR